MIASNRRIELNGTLACFPDGATIGITSPAAYCCPTPSLSGVRRRSASGSKRLIGKPIFSSCLIPTKRVPPLAQWLAVLLTCLKNPSTAKAATTICITISAAESLWATWMFRYKATKIGGATAGWASAGC